VLTAAPDTVMHWQIIAQQQQQRTGDKWLMIITITV